MINRNFDFEIPEGGGPSADAGPPEPGLPGPIGRGTERSRRRSPEGPEDAARARAGLGLEAASHRGLRLAQSGQRLSESQRHLYDKLVHP